jgi:hypothetical protein
MEMNEQYVNIKLIVNGITWIINEIQTSYQKSNDKTTLRNKNGYNQ